MIMRIKSISVDGYRRFQGQIIELEHLSSVIAGANNSGKTSFVDLLRIIFGDDGSLSADDLSIEHRVQWTKKLVTAAIEGEKVYSNLLSDQNFTLDAPKIEVRIEIQYDSTQDDIRLFADYLMDLDESKHSFFFRYVYSAKPELLVKSHTELHPLIQASILEHGWSSFDGIEPASTPFLKLQAAVDKIITDSSRAEVFYSDEKYENIVPMNSTKSFAKLFNFRAVKASRTLDDANDDNSGGLNKRLVAVAKEDEKWANLLNEFPNKVLEAIEKTDIRQITSEETLKSLNKVIKSVSLTNGTSQSDLFIDFQITEEHAIQLISRAMQTRYLGGGASLGEGSQGLGYSNLIYLHLEAESFIRAASAPENTFLVNLLLIEEPESHMHPQMQNAFIKHLFKRIEESGNLQALVTTHSNEIIRISKVTQLRVLRVEDASCRIIDLRKFHEEEVADKSTETQRLFNFLYSINFSDVLFADKVIMYEGDTERMYIQALIAERDDLQALRMQYISYVQVGGAYAHIYKPLIADTLHLKTMIVTDIDYEKESVTSTTDEIKKLTSTNSTLNNFFSKKIEGEVVNPSIGDLYDRVSANDGLAKLSTSNLVAVAFQSDKDGHARTLEEAIIAKILETDVWSTKTKKEWQAFKDESKLMFSISRTDAPSIRQIVASTSSNKTDFMYSLLLKEDFGTTVPTYITNALKWLNS